MAHTNPNPRLSRLTTDDPDDRDLIPVDAWASYSAKFILYRFAHPTRPMEEPMTAWLTQWTDCVMDGLNTVRLWRYEASSL